MGYIHWMNQQVRKANTLNVKLAHGVAMFFARSLAPADATGPRR